MRGRTVTVSMFALAATLAWTTPGAAAAQDAGTGGPSAGGAGADASVTSGPTEIIVTATKRAESIQTVPLSISAVTSDLLRNGNVSDFSRLDVLVPGVKFGQSGNDARPAIRGTRTQQVIGNADPLVAFYNDGIYRSRPGQALAIFLDTERVEVARGPQGTLFGRNSFGGAVNVISKAPRLGEADFGASLQVTNFSGIKGEGFVNLPLGDNVAIRLSGYSSKRDGWVKNDANRNNDLHDDNNQVVRGQIKFEQGGFSNTLRAEYWHGGGNGPGDFGYYTPGVPINPTTRATNGVTGVIDPVIAVVPGRGGGYGGLAAGTTGSRDWRHISTNYAFDRDVNQVTVSDDANVDLGFADLRGIFSYTHYKEYRQGDPDYSAQVLDGSYNRVKTRTVTEEVQLVSKPGGPLSWVAGFYGLQDRPSDLYVFGDDQNGAINPATGKAYYRNISLVPTRNRLYNLYVQGPFRSYTNSIAFYGDATYAITDALRVLGGVRWTQDKRKASIDNVPFAGNPDSYGSSLNTTEGPIRKTFDKVTWRAGAQFDVAPRSMLYGTYSTGFLAGGFSGSPSFAPGASSISSFNPQTVKAIEVGSKNVLFGGKLRANIAAYYNRYTNLVTQQLIFIGNAVSTITTNAGKIKSYGVEGEFDYYPTDQAYLGLRLAYTHARFGNYITGNSFTEGSNLTTGGVKLFQLDGLQVPLNPNFTATVVGSYDIDSGATGIFTPGVTVFASTKYRTSDQPYFFANQKGYATVDAFLRWKAAGDGKLVAQLFANNLTNKKILLRSTPNGGSVIYQDFAAPRIFGLRLSYNY